MGAPAHPAPRDALARRRRGGRLLRPTPWALLAFAFAAPSLVLSTPVHGLARIDNGTDQWLGLGAVVLTAYLCAGLLAGASARSARHAARRGSVTPLVAWVVLVVVDLARRVAIGRTWLTWPVARLWLAGGVAMVIASVAGASLGRSVAVLFPECGPRVSD